MSEAVSAGHSCTNDGMIRPIWVVGMGQRAGRKGNGASGSPSSGNVRMKLVSVGYFYPTPSV